jgi:hypothetical protein
MGMGETRSVREGPVNVNKLRCHKSRAWVPNEFLTEVAGFCDKGFFQITREFSFPCTFTPNQSLVVNLEDMELAEGEYDIEQVRCGNCGGPVEMVQVDEEEILARVRSKEVDMNVALRKRAEREAAGE